MSVKYIYIYIFFCYSILCEVILSATSLIDTSFYTTNANVIFAIFLFSFSLLESAYFSSLVYSSLSYAHYQTFSSNFPSNLNSQGHPIFRQSLLISDPVLTCISTFPSQHSYFTYTVDFGNGIPLINMFCLD